MLVLVLVIGVESAARIRDRLEACPTGGSHVRECDAFLPERKMVPISFRQGRKSTTDLSPLTGLGNGRVKELEALANPAINRWAILGRP